MLRRLAAAATVVLGLAPLPLAAGPSIWDLQVQPSTRLGLAFPGSGTQYYPVIAEMGIGIVRISAAWSRVEPQQGSFDFRGLDARIAALDALGIAPFVTFESDAAWGAAHTDKVKNGTPRALADWQNFVTRVVARYDGDGVDDMPGLRSPVRYYQVANEFLSPTNRSGGWAGRDGELVTLVNATHDAIKAQDARATFVLGGVASFNADIAVLALRDGDFTIEQRWSETSRTRFDKTNLQDPQVQDALKNRFLPVLQNTAYDVASVHLYGPEDRDAARMALFADLTGKPVISSECGGPTLDYGDAYTGHAHYRSVLRRNLNVWAAEGAFCLWFGLGEAITSTYGNARVQLYDKNAQPKPGTQAYRLLARLAAGMTQITVPGPDAFEITTPWGPVHIAFGAQGRSHITQVADATTSLCINDAGQRAALWTTWGLIPENCTNEGITLSGDALLTVLATKEVQP